MPKINLNFEKISVKPIAVSMYVPPITWKGDSIGHIGINDTFFWVLEGECFLLIESEASIVKAGQLAFLPKGKMRTYTQMSERFTMYELSFSAEADGQNLMELLHLTDSLFVVDVLERDMITSFFNEYNRIELSQDMIHDIAWCANILRIIQIYFKTHQKLYNSNRFLFQQVLNYITEHIGESIRTEDLAALMHMQTTYFIRKFSASIGMSPQTYIGHMRIYKAMSLLVSSDTPIEKISHMVGIDDPSYFSRFFKKHCNLTPSEYRNLFRKN